MSLKRPDDFCGPAPNRILALVRLGRRGDALGALRDAASRHRVAIEWLRAAWGEVCKALRPYTGKP